MSVTTLDRKTALIVIDLQTGIVSLPLAHPIKGVIENTVKLLNSFRAHTLPVVLVNVTGAPQGRTERNISRGSRTIDKDWAKLIPELNHQETDFLVTKQTRGAFMNTGLDNYLKKHCVTQVIIVGISTGSGVESTARQAHEYGYNVTLAIDAMTDTDEAIHHNSVTRIFPGIAETGTTDDIISLLDHKE